MPSAALRPCAGSPTCPHPATYRGRCADHARDQERTRYNADTRTWYSTEAWRVLRLSVLAEQPICADCQTKPSVECDHVVPHRGKYEFFWDRNNLQGLCKGCHGRKTARGE